MVVPPPHRWFFLVENPKKKWMRTGGSHLSQISGKPHIKKRENPAIVEHHPRQEPVGFLVCSAYVRLNKCNQETAAHWRADFDLPLVQTWLGDRQPRRLWAAPAVGPKSLCDTLRFDVDCWPIGSSSSSSSTSSSSSSSLSSSSWLWLSWYYQYIYVYIKLCLNLKI